MPEPTADRCLELEQWASEEMHADMDYIDAWAEYRVWFYQHYGAEWYGMTPMQEAIHGDR